MVRTFIAVEPTREIREAIYAAGQTLKGAGRLTPVGMDQMHITLKFLGEIPEKSVPEVSSALDSLSFSSYHLSSSSVSTFGRPPRVIKAEVHDNNKSSELSSMIDNKLYSLGFPKEDKKFSPHITIARVREYAPALDSKIASIKGLSFGECDISEVLFKKSVLTPAGPIYTTIHRVSL